MRGSISFHPVDLELFDGLISTLTSGAKVNPEGYLEDACRFRRNGWQASRYAAALRRIMSETGPPEAEPGSGVWAQVRARLERLGYRPDQVAARVSEIVDPDLHLEGRPFFITEGSADRVASLVEEYFRAGTAEAADALALEQLVRLDRDLARQVEPSEGAELTAEFTYRRDVLGDLKALYDLAGAARRGESWRSTDGTSRPALEAVREELAWRAVAAHARARPFWIARDVDGLETVCRAAGVHPPDVLVPAWRLFGAACGEFSGLRELLGTELGGPRAVGGFVAPEDLPRLLSHLSTHGARIIQAAARHGEGASCTTLLRKIRECLTYAETRGYGYLEAAGIVPPYFDADALGGETR